jgi:hypothetical protein
VGFKAEKNILWRHISIKIKELARSDPKELNPERLRLFLFHGAEGGTRTRFDSSKQHKIIHFF